MHLMRWQQLFPQIFLCSYPFPVHLKSIFVAGASWKVVQGKTKLTLPTYVRSEEDDPFRPTPLDIYLLYYLLWGLFPYFLLLGRIIINEWDLSPTQRLKFLPPHHLYPKNNTLKKLGLHHLPKTWPELELRGTPLNITMLEIHHQFSQYRDSRSQSL